MSKHLFEISSIKIISTLVLPTFRLGIMHINALELNIIVCNYLHVVQSFCFLIDSALYLTFDFILMVCLRNILLTNLIIFEIIAIQTSLASLFSHLGLISFWMIY